MKVKTKMNKNKIVLLKKPSLLLNFVFQTKIAGNVKQILMDYRKKLRKKNFFKKKIHNIKKNICLKSDTIRINQNHKPNYFY